MDRDDVVARVRAGYDAMRDGEVEPALALFSDDVVMHVVGDHPFAGDYAGRTAVRSYLADTAAAVGAGAFTVTSVMVDDVEPEVLVEGTAVDGVGGVGDVDGRQPFVRTVVHRLRFDGDLVVEMWRHAFDPGQEDEFWRRAGRPRPT